MLIESALPRLNPGGKLILLMLFDLSWISLGYIPTHFVFDQHPLLFTYTGLLMLGFHLLGGGHTALQEMRERIRTSVYTGIARELSSLAATAALVSAMLLIALVSRGVFWVLDTVKAITTVIKT